MNLQKNIPILYHSIIKIIRVIKRTMNIGLEAIEYHPPIENSPPIENGTPRAEGSPVATNSPIVSKKVLTEDLGKIFEMAICLLYDIEYDGKYKYGMEEAHSIKQRLSSLKTVFPHKLQHIAKNGSKYDFVDIENANIHLSAKTTKKDGKVCPQVIGQPSKKKFCEFFGIDISSDLDEIKAYIEQNPHKLLHLYFENTFDCPVIYYNKHKNLLWFIRRKHNIQWEKYNIGFTHIEKNKKWNESSGVIIHNTTIGEFQVHTHRDCIKFRWAFEKLLDMFKDDFEIIPIQSP